MAKETKVRFTYIGRRFSENTGKLYQVFLEEDGKTECSFKGTISRVWIGHGYVVTRKGKDSLSISRRPEEFDDKVDKRADEWRVKDLGAEAKAKQIRIAKKCDKLRDRLLPEINLIKQIVGQCTNTEIERFVHWLTDEITREADEKRNREFNERLRRAMKKSFRRGVFQGEQKEKAKNKPKEKTK